MINLIGCTNKQEVYHQVFQLRSTDLHVRAEATHAIQKIGVDTVPALIKILDKKESEYARFYGGTGC